MNFLSKSDRGLSCGAFVDVVTLGPTTGFSLVVSSLLFLVVCTDQTPQRKKPWRTAQRLPDGRGGSVAIVGTVEPVTRAGFQRQGSQVFGSFRSN